MIELLTGKFKFIRKIGKGGMAEIYLAIDRDTGEQVAIKLLHPDKKDSYADKKRFLHEINLTKKVDSPYVVKIHDWEWNDEIQYIVMDYIEGETLKSYIQSKSRLNVDEVVDFSKQLSLGFEAIHKAGIVHRDVKSTNIIITSHGQVKIIDFGIAISDESERLTKTDNIIASPQYIAPELINMEKATAKSDIYSLGIIVFEMLTGDVPFKGNDAYKTVLQHQNSNIPHVNKVFDNIPQALANIVIKATAKNPSKRYPNMYSMYEDLSNCLSNSRAFEPILVLADKPKTSFMQKVNSKWTLFFIIALIIAVLVSIIVILSLKAF
ncbi:MAG: serine/threonine protein kinase [Mycoplasmatales bacterium]|nr:serine/threonine protein kinase [Mycoplasmatales bacterium]